MRESSTNTETDAVAEAVVGSVHADVQRAALRDLVMLSAECGRIEAEIDRKHRAAVEAERGGFEKANEDIERRYQELKADLERKHADYLARIRSQYESDVNTLLATETAGRKRLDEEVALIEEEVRKRYKQETWLAESVLEGVENQLSADAKKSQETTARQLASLDVLEQQAVAVMEQYRQPWPAAEEADAAATDATGAEAEGVSFAECARQAEAHLARLVSLKAPRMVTGAVPILIGLILCAAAAGAAYVLSGASGSPWRMMGIAVACTLVAVVVAVAVLQGVARRETAEVATALRRSLAAARRAAMAEADRAARSRKQKHTEAVRKRDAEVEEARVRLAPIMSSAAEKRAARIKAFEDEHARLMSKIEAQRDLGLRETGEWWERALADLENGHQHELETARRRYEARMREIERRHAEAWSSLERRWNEGLARIQAPVRADSRAGDRLFHDWSDPAWQTWTPPTGFTPAVRFGRLHVDLTQITDKVPKQLTLPETFTVPALLAFPDRGSLLIHSDHAGRAEAIATLQAVMLRLLTSLPPGRVRFTIIDPVGLGQNFAGFMHLADHDEALVGSRIWTESDHIEQRLCDLTEHMETVIQKYLRNEFATIDDYNIQAGELAEPYRFLVIADFPTNLTDTAIQRLNSIAGTGARCGVYTLIARDMRQPLPPGAHIHELEAHSVNLVQENGRFVWNDEVFRRFPLTLESPPPEHFLTQVLHIVGRHARELKRVEVPFDCVVPPAERLWTGDSTEDVAVPIGRMGATRLQMLRLGRGVAQHALIGGKTGSGKSTLLHVIVTNLALWYGPDEIEFYLVDFKKGVEFKAYAACALPHARAVAVESDREFGLSVLQRVDAEMARRGAIFRQAGVQDLPSYRRATGLKLPRTLLIIDEFQEFFSEDDRLAQEAALLLDRLVRQGRAFGIHVLLGSQTIGGTSGLARSTIGQMAVRIALQTSEADSQIILGDGNSAARLLSRPGEAIYNGEAGLVEGNSPFQVAWLPDAQRDAYLSRIHRKAVEKAIVPQAAVVFEGNVPADITQNELLAGLIDADDWPAAPAAPRAWLGEPVAIKEPTAVVFRRQSGSHVLIVGQQDESAMALMAAAMISLAAQHRPAAAAFTVFDGSAAGSPLAGVFGRIQAAIPHPVRLVEYRAAEEGIAGLAAELQRRHANPHADPVAVYVFIYGMQRYRMLRRREESFSFSTSAEEAAPAPDKQFAELLREGPPLGMHVIAWADTVTTVERTLDRGSIREFDNRVLFQMSSTDSSNLIDSPLANKLGMYRALAFSEEQGTTEKFRPYALPEQTWLDHVRARLGGRRP